MFTIDLPLNENNWTCTGSTECFRRTPSILPENIIIKPNESKDFEVKLMEITTENKEANNKINGHYYFKIAMGFYIKKTDTHYSGEKQWNSMLIMIMRSMAMKISMLHKMKDQS